MSHRMFGICLLLAISAPLVAQEPPPGLVEAIRVEMIKKNQDPGGRPLPVVSHWASGFNKPNFSSDYQVSLLVKGGHMVPNLPLPGPGAMKNPAGAKEMLETLARWKAPLSLRGGQWESVLYEPEQPLNDPGKWRKLPVDKTPLDIDPTGKIKKRLSPFGAVEPWYEAGLYQTSSKAFKELEQWYPDPPRVTLLSNNEAGKLAPKLDVEAESKAYVDLHGKGKSKDYIREVMADGYAERYRNLIKGIKAGIDNEAWKKNTIAVAYNAFGPPHFGRMENWKSYSYFNDKRIQPWHLAWDGGSPSYYVHNWNDSTDYRVWSPQVEANNWVFMLEEAHKERPDFWFELSIWDGGKKPVYQKAGQEWSPQRYAGFVQFGMWLLTPRVVREFRGSIVPRAEYGKDFEALVAGVDRVWKDPVLTKFWRQGQLVANHAHPHPYQTDIPEKYRKVDRWFLLDTSVDAPRPWKLDTEIPVFALARVIGEKGARQWLLYAHSPLQNRKNVEIEVPEFGKATVEVSPGGVFYVLSEKGRSVSKVAE